MMFMLRVVVRLIVFIFFPFFVIGYLYRLFILLDWFCLLFWLWVFLTKKYHLIILVFSLYISFQTNCIAFNISFGWTVGPLRRSTNYWWFSLCYLQYIYPIIYCDFCLGLFPEVFCAFFFYLLHLTPSRRYTKPFI